MQNIRGTDRAFVSRWWNEERKIYQSAFPTFDAAQKVEREWNAQWKVHMDKRQPYFVQRITE